VYVFPAVPLSGTVGTPGRHTGTYAQTHADATLTSHLSVGFDATYYAVGGAIRRAGGRNSTYIALEVTSTWKGSTRSSRPERVQAVGID
jgi:hypothetical protein